MRFVTDDVEALIGIGDLESAGELLGWYEGCAQRLDRQSALASSARCRGLLASGRGDAEAACALLADAIDRYADVALPLDRARTVMALGVVERRLQRKRAARETLEEALSAFEGVGARLWAQRVRDELERIGGRRVGGRRAHRGGAPRRRARRPGTLEPRGRQRALPKREDGGVPPAQHLPQARRAVEDRARATHLRAPAEQRPGFSSFRRAAART